ncbi:MAG: Gfo/Idh/MocA family oxidoreductase [Bacteroidales bacterium]|jgi:predicted dehydrogenase|nr:Gfo/Idh/MocA family oxidoreductase [Bacteroidales bacterium]MBO5979982.1 Gfo/Idh/MocA family oxidoreductase [Bacteroidales bacterium]
MKRFLFLIMLATMSLFSCKDNDGVIRTDVPKRPAGQESVLGLKTEPLETVRIGIVGLGMRGGGAVERLTYVPDCRITAICDIEQQRVNSSADRLKARGIEGVQSYGGEAESWRGLCESGDVDLVYICTDWKNHVPIALYAMECGKHVAIEVPAATTLEEIWALVDMSEKTRRHCMMLENCVYDFFEMATLSMAQAGVFGEVIHVEGAYHHCLDPYWDEYWESWRLEYNKEHRGDVYPTHGIGPVCQVLGIHRGDRMKTLVSMDTKPINGPKIYELKNGVPCPEFKNADQTSTLISTEKGRTMLIQHDVMTPRPYDRLYQVVGTDGYAGKYPVQLYCLREKSSLEGGYDALGTEKIYSGDALKELQQKYPNPLMSPEFVELARSVGGHGGMDFIMDYRLVYCLHNGLPLDMDVYDLAEWCCVSDLSRLSLENGNRPVEVPDFTRGEWDVLNGFSYASVE